MCIRLLSWKLDGLMESVEIREFRSRIGRAIRALRDEERISAHKLAKILGVTQSTVSRIENGTTSISAERLCFLARVFNRPLSYFIGEQSPLAYDEEDILRAAAVHYGASHLKCKRIIDARLHYKTYADFLRAALNDISESRFAAAVAATLYHQAAHGGINHTRIITTVAHERLIANLLLIIELIIEGRLHIRRPENEKERVIRELKKLRSEIGGERQTDSAKSDISNIEADYVSRFINAGYYHE